MLKALTDSLKTLYQEQTRWLKRPIAGQDWHITDSFIQLALLLAATKEHSVARDDNAHKSLVAWHELYVNPAEKIAAAKKNIPYSQLFQALPETGNVAVQKVWLSGAAGSGKSTLLQRLVFESSQQQEEAQASKPAWLPHSVKGVIWVKLRDLKSYLDGDDIQHARLSQAKREEILARRLPYDEDGQLDPVAALSVYISSKQYGWNTGQKNEDWKTFLVQEAVSILWLIDGYDEIASLPKNHPIQVIFHQFFLKQRWALVTSRPYYRCPTERNDNRFRQVELLGFSHENVMAYVDKHFEKEPSNPGYSHLKTLLTQHLKLRGLAHIPVNLEILCAVMSSAVQPELSHLNTTGLYTQLFVYLMKRAYDASRLSADFIPICALTDEMTLLTSPKGQCLLTGLGALALAGLKNSQAQFDASELKAALCNAMPVAYGTNAQACFGDVFYSGLVRGFVWNKNQRDFEGQGEFLHLTLQEYLAAWSFAKQWKQSPQAVIFFVQEYKYDVHFARFWPFVVGLLGQEVNREYLDTLATLMDSPPLPLQGGYHSLLRIRCIEELLPNNLPLVWQSFVTQALNKAIYKSYGYYAFDPIIVELRQSPAWGKVLASQILDRLRHGTPEQQETALGQVRTLGSVVATESLVTQLIIIACLSPHAPQVRVSVCHVLSELGAAAATSQVLAALVSLLQDNNPYVRRLACEVLSTLGAAAATSEVLAVLMSLLQDDDPDICVSACDVLSELGAAAATSEVLAALVSLLQDDDPDVCVSACDVLSELGAAAATSEVLAALVSLLQDNDPTVRFIACDV
ncbi:MAG: HEAT repeat domain-containing protein, partial [Gammaproteobacteria bacterium]|nr:HEAT repeat domain-containing protein [Gammaproteobacteria bacterium]